jgi:outer membrane protein assembly factor BamB
VGGTVYSGNHNNRGSELDFFVAIYTSIGYELLSIPIAGSRNDMLHGIAVDQQGSVYVTGEQVTEAQSMNFTTYKIHPDGYVKWDESYNGPVGDEDAAMAMTLDLYGNVVVTGKSFQFVHDQSGPNRDIITLKYDAATGKAFWIGRYDGPGHSDDIPSAIASDRHGNVYVAAQSGGEKTKDIVILKYPPFP